MISIWRELLLQAVSPLESGVSALAVNGYRPPGEESFRPRKTAAVLVPVLDLEQPELVLTRRADHLVSHPGQVSFPGGAAEAGDTSAVQTALREAHEEIGLPAEITRPIGFLDRMDTISDFRVLPVVALIQPPVTWKPDLREVAEVFTVPLAILLDEQRFTARRVERDGQKYAIWSLQYDGYHIWGATAAMILNLTARMKAVHDQKTAV